MQRLRRRQYNFQTSLAGSTPPVEAKHECARPHMTSEHTWRASQSLQHAIGTAQCQRHNPFQAPQQTSQKRSLGSPRNENGWLQDEQQVPPLYDCMIKHTKEVHSTRVKNRSENYIFKVWQTKTKTVGSHSITTNAHICNMTTKNSCVRTHTRLLQCKLHRHRRNACTTHRSP